MCPRPPLTLCELGRTLYRAPLGTNENEGTGHGGFSEATFSPDSLDVVGLVGTAGPVSSSRPCPGMPLRSGSAQSSLSPSNWKRLQAGLLEGKCYAEGQPGETLEVISRCF